MGPHIWKRGAAQDTALFNIALNLGAALLVLWLIYKGV
jgi:hypothetical protein